MRASPHAGFARILGSSETRPLQRASDSAGTGAGRRGTTEHEDMGITGSWDLDR